MAENNLTKNRNGYGYKYTDLAQVHNYLEENNMKYYQYIKRIDQDDYIFTRRCIDDKWEEEAIQGCRVVNAILSGKSNPAQEQGSALTYARRYSLLMAFGLATEDDDAESLTKKDKETKKIDNLDEKVTETEAKAVFAAMTKKGIDVISSLKKKYNISNTKDLTKKQYFSILGAIKNMPDKAPTIENTEIEKEDTMAN